MPRSGLSLLVVVLGIRVLSGCSILGPDDCTLVGCGSSGLWVRLTSLPTEPYRVELLPQELIPSAPSVYAYECDGGSSCVQQIYFPQLFLSTFRVRVTTASGSVVNGFLDLHYEKTYPNGPRCGPTCLTATVTVDVPA